MRKQRLKVIPDRVFHKLWDAVGKYESEDIYISNIIDNDSIFNYRKYCLDYVEASFVLACIYRLKNMSFSDILNKAGTKKSTVSHIFCIPIRTIEDWYSGTNRSPAYIRLMMLKYFHLLDLGKHVRIESDINFYKTRPAVYVKHKTRNEKRVKAEPADTSLYTEEKPAAKTPENYYEEYIMSDDYEEFLDRLIAKTKENSVKKRAERNRSD